jgi:hypothetical protein
MGNLSKEKSWSKDRVQTSCETRIKKLKAILSKEMLSEAFRNQCKRNLKAISKTGS